MGTERGLHAYTKAFTHIPPITPPLGNILPHFGIFVKIECTIFLLAMLGIIIMIPEIKTDKTAKIS